MDHVVQQPSGMSAGSACLILAVAATIACQHNAKGLAANATRGIKSQVSQIDPAVVQTVADRAGRGAVTGSLAEIGTEENQSRLEAIARETADAAARGVMNGLVSARLQHIAEQTVASAVDGAKRSIETDLVGNRYFPRLASEMSASAVYGARDAVVDVFPDCGHVVDRRSCVEQHVADLSRSMSRSVAAGVVAGARVPAFALTFLMGALLTLLIVRMRSRRPPSDAPRPPWGSGARPAGRAP